ncbi:glycogen synthase GlgA [Thermodesulfobacteriota bacterium]
MKILFLSPEVAPFAKTGGLADVAGSLPKELRNLGADVCVIFPFYRVVRQGNFKAHEVLKGINIPLGQRQYSSSIYQVAWDGGVPVYLVEREDMYDRPNLYGDLRGDYYDNLERFTFLSHAALKFTEKNNFIPDIIHCHDWQTGLVPALIKGPYSSSRALKDTKSVFTIHNIGYQGIFPADDFNVTALPISDFFHQEGMEFWGNFSLLKAGIIYSDAVTTVSPQYARDIRTAEYGMGMEEILQFRGPSLSGILNGVDYGIWNPSDDQHIAEKYSVEDIKGKSVCKESIINEMGLSPSVKDGPLLCAVSRLDIQKGMDLIIKILDKILKMDVGIIILGSGGGEIEEKLLRVSKGNEGRVGIKIGFDDGLAHRIIAGSDIFMIPSRYEPCGLTQMYALKYGTVPVVRATGGLDDTISEYNPDTGKGNGFKFYAFEPNEFLDAIKRALKLYRNKGKWKNLIKTGMESDFSWGRSARKYLKLYETILRDNRRYSKNSRRGNLGSAVNSL